MKKSEAFKAAQVAVLDSNLPISVKTEVLEVLLWEEQLEKNFEEYQEKKKEEEKCQDSTVE
jgi:hypothetical protein